MKSNQMLNQIKTLLNIEVKLEEMKLENGTVVEADSFDAGNEIFIVTEEDKVALPVGDYVLEDSRILVVTEEGMIAEIKEVSDEVPEEETSDLTDDEKMAEIGDFEEMEKRIQNLEDAIADLKADKVEAAKVEEEIKEKLSAEPAAKAIKHNPEVTTSNDKFTFGQNRPMSTKDIVFSKLFK
jgi:hypothetical protein